MKKANKDIFISILITCLIIIFVYFSYYLWNSNFLRVIWSYIDDILLYKHSYSLIEDKSQNDIVIIKIDDKTINALQKSDVRILTFSKKLYSDLIEKLINDYKVSLIWIDIVFSNKSIYWEEDENTLKETFEKYKEKIVITTRWDEKEVPLCIYDNVKHWASEWIIEDRLRKFNIFYPNYNLTKNCKENNSNFNNWWIYSFSIEVYKKYLLNINKIKQSKYELLLENILKKLEKNNNIFYTRFFHNKEKNIWTLWFKSYSLIDVLNNENFDLNWKIVLIGEVWTLLHDKNLSPIDFKEKMPWVEFHANALQTIKSWIDLEYEKQKNKTNTHKSMFLFNINKKYIILILLLTSFIVYISVLKYKTYISLWIIVILFFIHLIIWIELFIIWIIYPIFFFTYAIIVWFMISYFYKYFTIDKQKIFIKRAFWMFLAPEIVDQITKDPSKLNLKWEKSNISIFFSDIENFTSISEKMKAEDLFSFLNEYFSLMTNILIRNRWTLDKYIWDSVMWFFNAPLKVENHEYLACKTAIEQLKAVKILSIKWSKKIHQNLNVRIWINSWDSIHWNLWSKWNRINYTIIWDNVNLASRLESINKEYWTNIIISETTQSKIKKFFITRELDTIKVKWKTKKTKIYELICFKWKEYNKVELINYKNWLNYYYAWEYEKAIIEFEKNKIDIPSRKMKARCLLAQEWKIKIISWSYQMINK